MATTAARFTPSEPERSTFWSHQANTAQLDQVHSLAVLDWVELDPARPIESKDYGNLHEQSGAGTHSAQRNNPRTSLSSTEEADSDAPSSIEQEAFLVPTPL